jgi:hypothetical protein
LFDTGERFFTPPEKETSMADPNQKPGQQQQGGPGQQKPGQQQQGGEHKPGQQQGGGQQKPGQQSQQPGKPGQQGNMNR